MARGDTPIEKRYQQIRELCEKGLGYREIAKELGISIETTRFYGGKMGLHEIWREQKMEKIRKLHAQGLTNPEIKRVLHMCTETISSYLKKMGLKENDEGKIKWRLGQYSGEVAPRTKSRGAEVE